MQLKVNNVQIYQYWLKGQMTSQLYLTAKLMYTLFNCIRHAQKHEILSWSMNSAQNMYKRQNEDQNV